MILDQFTHITTFLTARQVPMNFTSVHRWKLVTQSAYFLLITRQLYKIGVDGILCRCVLEHELHAILEDSTHEELWEDTMQEKWQQGIAHMIMVADAIPQCQRVLQILWCFPIYR